MAPRIGRAPGIADDASLTDGLLRTNLRYEIHSEKAFLPSRKRVWTDRRCGVPFAGGMVCLSRKISGRCASFTVTWWWAGAPRCGFPKGPGLPEPGLDEVGGGARLRNDQNHSGCRFLFHRDTDRCDQKTTRLGPALSPQWFQTVVLATLFAETARHATLREDVLGV